MRDASDVNRAQYQNSKMDTPIETSLMVSEDLPNTKTHLYGDANLFSTETKARHFVLPFTQTTSIQRLHSEQNAAHSVNLGFV